MGEVPLWVLAEGGAGEGSGVDPPLCQVRDATARAVSEARILQQDYTKGRVVVLGRDRFG